MWTGKEEPPELKKLSLALENLKKQHSPVQLSESRIGPPLRRLLINEAEGEHGAQHYH